MTDLNRIDSSNLDAIKSDGTVISANRTMTGGSLTVLGCTLVTATTYYFPFGAPRSPVPRETPYLELQLRWDAAVIFTATLESTLVPATPQAGDPRGPAQLAEQDTTAGYWLPESLPAAQVLVVGAGATYTAPTLTVAGGAAGGAIFRIFNYSSARGHAKLVIGGTGGVIRAAVHGKVAA